MSLLNRRNTMQVEQIVMGNPLDNLEVLHMEEKSGATRDYSIRRALYKALNNLINLERDEDEGAVERDEDKAGLEKEEDRCGGLEKEEERDEMGCDGCEGSDR